MYKVYIRPLKVEDAKISYQWRNDPEIWKFTGSKPDREITYEIEKEWIKKVISDESCRRFAIIADGNYIGNIQLTNIKDKKAEYHIFIGDKLWWGKGIAHLATYQILHYAKEELQLEEVFLSVREENIAAIKSYIKSSFVERENADGWIKMVCALEQLPEPMVSVFVMVYNHEKYLHECLDGILMQQCNFAFNIVVGEDCSPDRSREILLEYNQKYPGKFKLLLHDKNIGAVANQNAVLSACTGKYIALCEGDDYWTDPLKLQKQVFFLEENEEYGLIHTNYKKFFNKSAKFFDHCPVPDVSRVDENEYYLTTGDIRTCTVLFRAKYIERINDLFNQKFMQNAVIGDRPIFLLIGKISKLYFLNNITSVYRITSSESASHFSNIFDYYDYLIKTAEINYEALKYLDYTAEIYNKYNDRIKYFNLFSLMKLDKLQFHREFLINVILMKLSISQIKEILSIYRKV